MSIRKLMGMKDGIDDFRIQVSPRTLTLPKNCKAFVLYLEKGMQIIGKFETPEGGALRDSFYRFRHPPCAAFRLNNITHSTYTWTLYSLTQANEENYQDSACFNIQRTVKLYQMQLLEKERELQTSIREKKVSKAKVLELWGEVRREMKSSRSIQKCVFVNQDYQIEFQIDIKNTLDFQLELMQEEEQNVAMRRVRSDQLRSSKSKPSSTVIEVESATYRSLPQIKDEINTKQTIQSDVGNIPTEGDGQGPNEENTTVKVVNPSGEEVDNQQEAFLAGSNRRPSEQLLPFALPKKFSLLSDIIEASQENSSSYHPDRSSSHGKYFPRNTLDLVLQPKIDQSQSLNKFKTLPYESHHRLDVGDQFRRAQTAQKNLSEIGSQIQESYLSANEKPPEKEVKNILNKIPKKWVIIAFFIILFVVLAIPHLNIPPKKARRKARAH